MHQRVQQPLPRHRAFSSLQLCRTEQLPLPEDPAEVKVDLEACREIKTLAGQISDRLREAESYDSSACYLPHSQDGTPIIGKISKVNNKHPGVIWKSF